MFNQWTTVYCHKGFEIETMNVSKKHVDMGYRIKGYETLSLFNTVQEAVDYIDAGKVYII